MLLLGKIGVLRPSLVEMVATEYVGDERVRACDSVADWGSGVGDVELLCEPTGFPAGEMRVSRSALWREYKRRCLASGSLPWYCGGELARGSERNCTFCIDRGPPILSATEE